MDCHLVCLLILAHHGHCLTMHCIAFDRKGRSRSARLRTHAGMTHLLHRSMRLMATLRPLRPGSMAYMTLLQAPLLQTEWPIRWHPVLDTIPVGGLGAVTASAQSVAKPQGHMAAPLHSLVSGMRRTA